MTRLTAPLFSVAASGKLADALVFVNSRGRTHVRPYARPSNPNTQRQSSSRAAFRYITQIWKHLSAEFRAEWNAAYHELYLSGFNFFTRTNMDRWSKFLAPLHTLSGNPGTYPAAPYMPVVGVISGVANVTWVTIAPGYHAICGSALFRSNSPMKGLSTRDCLVILPSEVNMGMDYSDSPLLSGTYYYRTANFNIYGDWSDPSENVEVIVP